MMLTQRNGIDVKAELCKEGLQHIEKFMVWLCDVKIGPVGDAWNAVSLRKLRNSVECVGSNVVLSHDMQANFVVLIKTLQN